MSRPAAASKGGAPAVLVVGEDCRYDLSRLQEADKVLKLAKVRVLAVGNKTNAVVALQRHHRIKECSLEAGSANKRPIETYT